MEEPVEGGDEDLADVEDGGHQVVAGASVEQEQDDAQADDELDQAKDEDGDPAGHLGAARARPGGATTVRPHRFLAPDSGFLGDDRAVDLIDSQ